jgi:ABC-2 type transport system permease protein
VIIVGSQMVFNGKLDSLSELGEHHTLAAAIAFGIGVYVLMLSAFQTLNNEGNSCGCCTPCRAPSKAC